MDEISSQRADDLTQRSSERGDDKATRIAREQESDDVNEASGSGKVPAPEGDNAGENKLATSLDDE